MTKSRLIIVFISLLLLVNFTTVGAVELTITDNGAGSENEITATQQTNTTVEQNNQMQINNDIQTSAETGNNEVSGNDGDANISTGDINHQITVENQTNVSQINNQCCPVSETTVTISGNGSGSQNSINIDNNEQTNISVNQTAQIDNQISGQANTGGNQVIGDNGDVSIDTGEIRTNGDIDNHDTNITDITLSRDNTGASVKITGNGTDSTNVISINQTIQDTININNNALIQNDINWDLSTGDNFAEGNLGDIAIFTGDIAFDLKINNGPINISKVTIICCEASPTPTPSPSPSLSPTPSPTSSPTPTSSPSPAEESAGEGGGAAGAAAAAAGEAGEVLGAAAGEVLAAAGNYWLVLLTTLGLLTLGGGLYFRRGSRSDTTIKRLKLLS